MNRAWSVIAALALSLPAALAQADGNPAEGKKIAEAVCVACHGVDGNSTDPQYPRLAGQHANYMVKALTDYKSGARQNPIMAGFAGQLDDAAMKNVAAWYASQTGTLHTAEIKK